jgi:hypothetical protein
MEDKTLNNLEFNNEKIKKIISKNKDEFDLINSIVSKCFYIKENNININKDILVYKLFIDIISKFDIHKKNLKKKKNLNEELRCKGRKIDGKQCTRKKKDNKEFCKSHSEKLPNGRIDSPIKTVKVKERRGRRPINNRDSRDQDESYSKLFIDIIEGERYKSDINNNVFTYDEPIRYLGIKTLEGKIKYIKSDENIANLKDTVNYLG